MRLLLATHNEHKRRELGRLLPDHEVVLLPDAVQLPPEDGETFAENALGKARAAAAATGEVTIADDSGHRSGGARRRPGGALGALRRRARHRPAEPRQAAARGARGQRAWPTCARSSTWTPRLESSGCSRSAAPAASPPRRAERAALATTPRSCPTTALSRGRPTLTMAELTAEQKDAISHRGRAARALRGSWLKTG